MFNTAETNLICIYNLGSRGGLIAELEEMKGYLTLEEADLLELTNNVLDKLQALSDREFDQLTLEPDYQKGWEG